MINNNKQQIKMNKKDNIEIYPTTNLISFKSIYKLLNKFENYYGVEEKVDFDHLVKKHGLTNNSNVIYVSIDKAFETFKNTINKIEKKRSIKNV